jgi:hypothetical protein
MGIAGARQEDAEGAIRATLQDYFDGLYRMDEAKLRSAFHPGASLFGHLRGTFTHSSLDQWIGRISAQPVPAQTGEAFEGTVVSVDVTGDAALAKVSELYRGLRFTDYLSLILVDGRWAIVAKVYHHN